ncbi:U3 small nucleolar RNA-associated protein 10 [Neolecta irregularis DAH-3]|uniref:U3 small nucleolar RNA-associated protein 10 n=1 Tax=Neolecta irregularis (strain DAH-3) TaxID=1198029 RepID=A0A1U7LWL2_NEOID|nr:U3 small nucleolar RNA-associated protein 10 [Neolecta irregularis DAH-3]|eukprot:OLL27008.1 U3 small nucleolar RNA-associated protein 10 [Neolecta irregularis DAH-3]
MTTALATQLQELRASAVNAPYQNQFKKVASLLYDISEAAEKNIDTIYEIGREAFDELCEIDPRLRQFETILFSEGSKNVDRFLQTKADNDALNGVLSTFIHILSPHFLLGATTRALEWLVRRFRIHNYNAETLLLTFLPYYSHPTFARLLVIVTLPQPIWSFLEARKKDRSAPSRHEIVMSLAQDPTFYNIVAQFVEDMASEQKGYHALSAFWASVAVEAILRMRQAKVDEDLIMQRTLPFAAEGTQFHAAPEHQISNYMVLTVLASSGTITDQILVTIMNGISTTWSKRTFKSALLCIAQLMQVREGNPPLPDGVYKAMNDAKETEILLQEIVSKFRADKLVTGFLIRLIKSSVLTSDSIKRIEGYVRSGRISETQTKVIFRELIESTLKKNTPGTRVQISEMLNSLKNDKVLSRILNIVLAEDIERTEKLEMTLQITLQTNEIQSEISMESNSHTNDPETFEKMLQNFQQLEVIPESFFGNILSSDLENLTAIFDRASTSRDDIETLMKSSFFPKDELSLITFFGYVWSITTHVNRSRVMALNLVEDVVSSSEYTDFQILIPYLLIVLGDRSLKIRTAAVSAFQEVIKMYDKVQTSPIGHIVGYGDNSKNIKWLPWSVAKYFANEVIAPHLEEYLLDEEKIMKIIGHLLSGIGRKGAGKTKTEILSFLASTAIVTPILCVQVGLTNQINTVDAALKTELLFPLLKSATSNSISEFFNKCVKEGINVFSAKRSFVAIIAPGENGDGLAYLKELLSSEDAELASLACERTCALWSSMKRDSQVTFASALLKIVVAGSAPIVQNAIEALQKISLSTQIFENILKEIVIFSKVTSKSTPKRARTQISSAAKFKETAESILHELNVTLELLEKQNPEEKSSLIGLLFGKLADVLLIEEDTRISASYAKQILLSCMNSMVEGCKNSKSKFETKDIRIDVLVNCIRSSTSPQVHNRALLLAANLAELCPELVLHSVMPIFTFVGANVLQQDDSYSVHVIQQTVQNIIPALVKTSKDADQAVLDSVGVLNTFVNAYTHIPKHRRVKLFSALIETLGASDFLYAILSLLAEQSLSFHSRSADKASLKDFIPVLVKSFPLDVQITTIRKMTMLVKQFLEINHRGEIEGLLRMFSLEHHASEELEPIFCEIVNFMNLVLRSKSFHGAVRTRGGGESNCNYSSLIRELLMVVTECRNKKVSDGLFISLDCTLKLLPWSSFATTFQDIMKSDQEKFRRSSIAIVKSRLEIENAKTETQRKQALSILDSLIENISVRFENRTIQAAINCVTIMARKYSSFEPTCFSGLIPMLCGDSALRHDSLDVRISALV